MSPFVFIVRFEHKSAVEGAFALLSEQSKVESCVVEPEALRIRFLATLQTGVPILERLHDKGGMVFAERYPLEKAREEH